MGGGQVRGIGCKPNQGILHALISVWFSQLKMTIAVHSWLVPILHCLNIAPIYYFHMELSHAEESPFSCYLIMLSSTKIFFRGDSSLIWLWVIHKHWMPREVTGMVNFIHKNNEESCGTVKTNRFILTRRAFATCYIQLGYNLCTVYMWLSICTHVLYSYSHVPFCKAAVYAIRSLHFWGVQFTLMLLKEMHVQYNNSWHCGIPKPGKNVGQGLFCNTEFQKCSASSFSLLH